MKNNNGKKYFVAEAGFLKCQFVFCSKTNLKSLVSLEKERICSKNGFFFKIIFKSVHEKRLCIMHVLFFATEIANASLNNIIEQNPSTSLFIRRNLPNTI